MAREVYVRRTDFGPQIRDYETEELIWHCYDDDDVKRSIELEGFKLRSYSRRYYSDAASKEANNASIS